MLIYFYSDKGEHVGVVTNRFKDRSTNVTLTNQNVLSSISSFLYKAPYEELLMVVKINNGGSIENMVNESFALIVRPEYIQHAQHGMLYTGLADIAVIEVTSGQNGELAMSSAHRIRYEDKDLRYLVQFPSSKSHKDYMQYIIISARQYLYDEPTSVQVKLPTRETIHKHKKLISNYDNLEVVVERDDGTLIGGEYTNGETISVSLYSEGLPKRVLLICRKGDLSGTLIKSDKGLVVISRVRSTFSLPDDILSSPDDIEERLLPSKLFSQKYIVPLPRLPDTLSRRYEGELKGYVNIISEKRTHLAVGNHLVTLEPYAMFEKEIESQSWAVNSLHPISVSLVLLLKSEQSPYCIGTALFTLLSQRLWTNSYSIHVPDNGRDYLAIIVTHSEHTDQLLMNEQWIYTHWAQADASYSAGSLHLSPGDHRIRGRLSSCKLALYLVIIASDSLAATPAHVRRPPITDEDLSQCDVTPSYNTEGKQFGMADYMDNDCDGRIDEDNCHGQLVHYDDDKDGLLEEDCSGFPLTLFKSACNRSSECQIFGQKFVCQRMERNVSLCMCPDAYSSHDGLDYIYDYLDGLCWPLGLRNSEGKQQAVQVKEQSNQAHSCGASYYAIENKEFKWCSCSLGEDYNYCLGFGDSNLCSSDSFVCQQWQKCVGNNREYFCLERALCGEFPQYRGSVCAEGLTCIVEHNQQKCLDLTNNCIEEVSGIICPPTLRCVDGVNTFHCVSDYKPCDESLASLYPPCKEHYTCISASFSSTYRCEPINGHSEDETCLPNPCVTGHICVLLLRGYKCIEHIECQEGMIHSCSADQVCLLVDMGSYLCVSETVIQKQLGVEDDYNEHEQLSAAYMAKSSSLVTLGLMSLALIPIVHIILIFTQNWQNSRGIVRRPLIDEPTSYTKDESYGRYENLYQRKATRFYQPD